MLDINISENNGYVAVPVVGREEGEPHSCGEGGGRATWHQSVEVLRGLNREREERRCCGGRVFCQGLNCRVTTMTMTTKVENEEDGM